MNSRALAASTLDTVIRHTYPLELALTKTFDDINDPQERSFIQELCYGVMRWYPRLDFIANELLEKPLKRKDSDINLLLLLGIYQLDFMRTPEHAAVSATVDACHTLNKSWAKKLINAVLRRYQREKPLLQERINSTGSARFAHPEWLINQIKQDWPDHWMALLEKNNCYPPMHLRVNLRLNSRMDYLEQLRSRELLANPLALMDCAVSLSRPVPVDDLPGFSSGYVSVQDQGAQLAVAILDLSAGHRVLDACAAPGGKSAHMCESEPELGELVAIDKDARRIALLKTTRQRLKTDMHIIEADASAIETWWDGNQFDRILLDAPCSATGVIRRHPDIKMLRGAKQMSSLIHKQSVLLSRLWPLLGEGGKMVYATCSFLQQENDLQIEKHLHENSDAKLMTINANWGVATRYGRQTLPILDETDGFYYAVLEKKHTK